MQIYKLIQVNPWISSPQVASQLDMSRVTAFSYLKELKEDGLLYSLGNRKSTRYYPIELDAVIENLQHEKTKSLSEICNIIKDYIVKRTLHDHNEIIDDNVVEELFDNYFMYIDKNDVFHIWVLGFYYWCKEKQFWDRVTEKAYEYFELVWSFEYRRKANGLFDWTESLIANLSEFSNIAIDKLYFQNLFALPNGFWRTRAALELAYWKLNGNPIFLSHAIHSALDSIRNYITKNSIDWVVLIPPTQSREIQFRDILKKELKIKLKEIKAEKIRDPRRIMQPQKTIQWKAEKIRNAEISMEIKDFHKEDYTHILLLDDSFTTGATPNSLALKIRANWFTGKITTITICGSFNYDLAITEDEI